MTLCMFQTPAGARRETETESEAAIAAITTEVILPARGSRRWASSSASPRPGGSVRIVCLRLRVRIRADGELVGRCFRRERTVYILVRVGQLCCRPFTCIYPCIVVRRSGRVMKHSVLHVCQCVG